MVALVTDVTYPHHQSRANVSIYVNDRNDNAPTIEYPTSTDLPIYISALSPSGHEVARVRAHDADVGENARLEYTIAKGRRCSVSLYYILDMLWHWPVLSGGAVNNSRNVLINI